MLQKNKEQMRPPPPPPPALPTLTSMSLPKMYTLVIERENRCRLTDCNTNSSHPLPPPPPAGSVSVMSSVDSKSKPAPNTHSSLAINSHLIRTTSKCIGTTTSNSNVNGSSSRALMEYSNNQECFL